jgi:TatD DNase family protein
MYIDSHAHIFFDEFAEDIVEVLHRSKEAGVSTIIVPGTNLETSRKSISLAEAFDGVYACVGFHPHDAIEASDDALAQIEELSHHPKVVAIGEIGLDFFYDYSPRDRQFEVLRKQLAIAVRRDLPVVVHTRDSVAEAIGEMRVIAEKHSEWRTSGYQRGPVQGARGVFHCFSGTADEAKTLFSYGFFVSYPGIVTFKNSVALETLKSIGYEHILLETDSPFLAPVPLRGKRNEPANIPLIANKIAEAFQTTPMVVAKHASANTRHLFSLP